MTNLDSILKSRDITLSTKVPLVKAMLRRRREQVLPTGIKWSLGILHYFEKQSLKEQHPEPPDPEGGCEKGVEGSLWGLLPACSLGWSVRWLPCLAISQLCPLGGTQSWASVYGSAEELLFHEPPLADLMDSRSHRLDPMSQVSILLGPFCLLRLPMKLLC